VTSFVWAAGNQISADVEGYTRLEEPDESITWARPYPPESFMAVESGTRASQARLAWLYSAEDAGDASVAHIYDISSLQHRARFDLKATPCGRLLLEAGMLVVGCRNHCIDIWDVADGTLKRRLRWPACSFDPRKRMPRLSAIATDGVDLFCSFHAKSVGNAMHGPIKVWTLAL
jgi:hypothetical protein